MPRFERMNQLTAQDSSISVRNTLRYIREQKGMDEVELGMGNPMAINQLLAHHAVIFEPVKGIAYISAAPFQENVFNAYDVNSIKHMAGFELANSPEIDSLRLEQDPFFSSKSFENYKQYKSLKVEFLARSNNESPAQDFVEKWIATNPEYYEPYLLLGDFYFEKEDFANAKRYYKQASSKAIPYLATKTHINENLGEIK